MSIAQSLSWELVAQNELPHSEKQRTALEICYGVALALSDAGLFSSVMTAIIEQVSDPNMQRQLRAYTAIGLK